MKNDFNLRKELTQENMKKAISEAGGLFYQYRPCRRDASTIYDIENIRHALNTTSQMNWTNLTGRNLSSLKLFN